MPAQGQAEKRDSEARGEAPSSWPVTAKEEVKTICPL